ncbi:MAG: FAD-binding domain-containing protein [Hyphomicrobiales bacterium]
MSQLPLFEETNADAVEWKPTREAGLERLRSFLPRTGRAYASTRNYDLGPESRGNISCLSPWIRHRLILEEEVVRETLGRFSFSSAEKFIQEVFWRSYFKGWLEHRPDVWTRYCIDRDRLIETLTADQSLQSRYDAAILGTTEIDCFDAWAKELVSTGYLHNHARMWFASIWIFTLKLPWQLGADFFLRHLLDGDPASNTCSWRWVAGLHTKGKNYAARSANIEEYTGGRFSPKGLVVDPAPLMEDWDDTPSSMPTVEQALGDEAYGFIITNEDCNAETLPLSHYPVGLIGLTSNKDTTALDESQHKTAFIDHAIADAMERGKTAFDCEGEITKSDNWADNLIAFSEQLNVKTLAVSYLPVGPVRDKMEQAKPSLTDAGIKLVEIMRPYDQACWPHATKGFFKLKKKLPAIIEELGFSD